MDEKPFPIPDDVATNYPAVLYQRLDDDQYFGVVYKRAPADVDDWIIDGDSVTFANVPYYQFLDGVP